MATNKVNKHCEAVNNYWKNTTIQTSNVTNRVPQKTVETTL